MFVSRDKFIEQTQKVNALEDKIKVLNHSVECLVDSIKDLKIDIFKLQNPPKFKLGDTVDIYKNKFDGRQNYAINKAEDKIDNNPYVIIEINLNIIDKIWIYSCINEKFKKIRINEVRLELSDKKIQCSKEK